MDYKFIKSAQYEKIPCNLCGDNDFKVLSKKDRYGFSVRTVICKNCGLIFINPRMTKDYYDKFYKNEYREILFQYKGKTKTKDKMFSSSTKWGERVAKKLEKFINPGILLEVGSSVGGVLNGFKNVIPSISVLGVEPSQEETDYANSRGIKTSCSLIENFKEEIPPVYNISIIRSLNHLLDPDYFFQWTYNSLKDGGKLIIVVYDFVKFCEKKGKVFTQIDHPFMFVAETLKMLVENNGFKIDYLDREENYIYLVASKNSLKENKLPNKNYYKKIVKSLNSRRLFLVNLKSRLIK